MFVVLCLSWPGAPEATAKADGYVSCSASRTAADGCTQKLHIYHGQLNHNHKKPRCTAGGKATALKRKRETGQNDGMHRMSCGKTSRADCCTACRRISRK